MPVWNYTGITPRARSKPKPAPAPKPPASAPAAAEPRAFETANGGPGLMTPNDEALRSRVRALRSQVARGGSSDLRARLDQAERECRARNLRID